MSILARLAAFQGIDINEGPLIDGRISVSQAVEEAAQSEAVTAIEAQEQRLADLDSPGDDGGDEGGDNQGQAAIKYKIVGNPPNYYVIAADDGTYTSQSAAQSDADRLNTNFLNNQPQDDSGAGGDDQPPPPVIPGTTEVPGDETEEFDAREYANTNYEWLGDELIDIFLEEYNSNGGDDEEAIRVLRTTQAYKDKFKGIFRDDGKTLRIEGNQPERQYIKIKEDYQNLLADYNLNPNYFEDKIETLFRNDVAPSVFERRLSVAYNTLFPQFEAVKTYYVNNYPNIFPSTEDITDEAIFASFIDEDVSADIINQRVNVAQIGGAFLEQDFAISTEQAQRLVSAGLTGQGAQRIAARAETQLPRLQRLAQRFTGREDIFGLSEFIEAEVFGSGVAERVRERLEAEQATVFTREGGAAQTQAGVTGLVET